MFGGIDVRGDLLCFGHSDSRGRILVVDTARRAIRATWSFGEEEGFAEVGGLCLDRDGHVLVADTCNDRVRRFTLFGRPAGRIGRDLPGRRKSAWHDERGYLHRPRGVAVDGLGHVLVACGDRPLVHGVQRFDAAGRPCGMLRAFGEPGETFGAPMGIAVAAGRLLVADTFNGCLQIFRPEGRFMGMFSTATEPGERSQPTSVAFLAPDQVLVAQWKEASGVKRFDGGGAYRGPFAEGGLEEGRVHEPTGLAVDGRGRVYVLDRDGERVQCFDRQGRLLRVVLDLARVPLPGP